MPRQKKQLFSLTETAALVPPPKEKLNNAPEREKWKKKLGRRGLEKRERENQRKRKAIFLEEFKIQRPRGRRISAQQVETLRGLREYLRNTYEGSLDNFTHFTPKMIEFCRHYAKNGRTNIAGAARAAGYQASDSEHMRQCGWRVLRQPFVEDLIQMFEIEEKARLMITVEDVVAWFKKIATAAMDSGDYTNANRSMEALAKYLQMFTEKREITHKIIHSHADLDARIQELTAILGEVKPEIENRIDESFRIELASQPVRSQD
jgi:acyl carrier protein phosphodiesterase